MSKMSFWVSVTKKPVSSGGISLFDKIMAQAGLIPISGRASSPQPTPGGKSFTYPKLIKWRLDPNFWRRFKIKRSTETIKRF